MSWISEMMKWRREMGCTAQGMNMHVNACFDVLEVHNLIWNQMGVHGQVVDMHVIACFCLV